MNCALYNVRSIFMNKRNRHKYIDLPSLRLVKEMSSTQGSCVHKHCIYSNSVSMDVCYKQVSD
jgi:hypothetical protein